ncbi:MAG: hypothetical protein OEY55_01205 [Acidimicrobiia bacterium]|nr:hypothetical protein [Acidimicrobiia bacterium]MDH5420401.1 hypothetical protein [Acidimicrobiia bacterium]MDH5503544.1 hypothetical protein [Acidimicrobiia bacterium]
MDSVLRHRAFALLFSVLIGVAVASIPAMAASGPLDAIVAEYEAASEAKLAWFETKMDGSASAKQRSQWYEQTLTWLAQKADDTLEDLVTAAANDPVLLAQVPGLAQEIADLEHEFLEEVEDTYNSYVEPVVTTTMTLPPITTTTPQLPPITTTTLPSKTTTSTTSTSTSTTTTTTTVPAATTPTTRPVSGSATAAPPPSAGGSSSAGPAVSPEDVTVVQATIAAEGGEAGSQVLSELASLSVPRSQFLFNVEPSEVASAQQMLIPYEPANLPSRLPAPVTSLLAVLQMVLGAFVSSFRQIGGPAAAGAFYLGYEVWRHLRSKAPGGLPA